MEQLSPDRPTAAISSPVGPVPRGTIVSSGNQRLSTRAKGRFVGRIEKSVSIRQVRVELLKEKVYSQGVCKTLVNGCS